MAEEQLYVVDGQVAVPAERIKLADAGYLERKHLQEWVIAHPEILGENVRVLTFEFDRWTTASGPTWERLDVLALDQTGRLVVAELKRGSAPDTVIVQALNYAAMASRFSLDLLAETYGQHRRGDQSTTELLDELQEWAPALSDETLSSPRIVLIAEDFGPVMTNTAMFLIEQGLDLRLVRVSLYRIADDTLALAVSQLLPVPDAEDFMVRPRSAGAIQRATRAAAARRASIPERLVAAGLFSDGQELRIVVPAGVQEDRETIAEWLAEDEARSMGRWRQDPRAPVEWAADGKAWNLSTLIRHIIETATGAPPHTKPWGPNWFQTEAGQVLYKLAEGLPDTGESLAGFDWATLHAILDSVPHGSWTTYGDLAQVVGTAPQPLGGHLGVCRQCPNTWRVLGSDGRPRLSFSWLDPSESRSQEEVLASEGVTFTNGAAAPNKRLGPSKLNDLLVRPRLT